MDFFGVGLGEVALVLVIAMIIWGPGRMVEIGRKLGKLAASLRNATTNISQQVTRELQEQDEDKGPPPAKKGDEQT